MAPAQISRDAYLLLGTFGRTGKAALRVHPSRFSPTSVQLNSEINGAFLCKRHQQRHLEFCTILQSEGKAVLRVRTRAKSRENGHAHGGDGLDCEEERYP